MGALACRVVCSCSGQGTRIGPLLLLAVLLLLAACGGESEQVPGAATLTSDEGSVYRMAPVKTSTPMVEQAATGPAATKPPQPTNTRVLPQTPMATADPNALKKSDVPRISVEEAKAKMDAGQAVMVDVRGAAAYDLAHIAGAISMTGGEVAKRHGELPADKLTIFY